MAGEDKLARVQAQAEEWQHFDSIEGRRLVAEAQSLRLQLETQGRARDDVLHRIREAEESSCRASRSASSFRSDCGILKGTREAIFLEEVSCRERLGAVSRAQIQTSTALREL